MPEVNLDQLARLLGCSLPTMRKLIVDYPAVPVIERGNHGRQWRFDAESVVAFFQAEREAEEARRAERNEALAQMILPLKGKTEDGTSISLDDQLKAVKLRAAQREELKETRFLVPTHEIRSALESALRQYGQMQEAAIVRVCKRLNLPDAVRRALEQEFSETRISFVKLAENILKTTEGENEPASLFG